MCHRLDRLSVNDEIQQDGGGWDVVIPQSVVDQLVVPHPLTGSGIQTDQTLPEQIVPRPATVEIVVKSAEGQIEVTEVVIGGHHGPDIGGPVLLPGTGANVKATHIPGRHERRLIPSETPIHPGGADNDDVAADDRWRYGTGPVPRSRNDFSHGRASLPIGVSGYHTGVSISAAS